MYDLLCPQRLHMAPPKLLTDAQVQRFIDDGYLALPVDELGEDFHQTL